MIKRKADLLDADKIRRTLVRLAHEIIEKNPNLEDLAIIGIRTRGDIIAKRLFSIIKDISQKQIHIGTLDVTFYRDDFRTNLGTPKVGPSKILFDICIKNNLYNIIFSSTAAIYGNGEKNLISENSKIKPTNPYGESKYKIEKYLIELKDKINFIIL